MLTAAGRDAVLRDDGSSRISFVACLRLVNRAGRSLFDCSDASQLDLSPPQIGVLADVAAPGGPGGVASAAGSDPAVQLLNASANALPAKGQNATLPNGDSVAARLPSQPPASRSDIAGATTRVFDDQGVPIDIAVTFDQQQLAVAWSDIVDAESGVIRIWMALGRQPFADDVVAKHVISGQPEGSSGAAIADPTGNVTFTRLPLQARGRYFASIWVENGAGRVVRFASDGVVVDVDPPSCENAWVRDGVRQLTSSARSSGIAFTRDASSVAWHGGGWTDADTSISRYYFRVCNVAGTECPLGWTDAGESPDGGAGGLSMRPGITYQAHVRGFDQGNMWCEARSPGFVADPSPPIVQVLKTNAWLGRWSDLSFHWQGVSDPESGIKKAWWCVGSEIGGSDLLPC